MNTKQILQILKVISWIAFIGLCIKTGSMVVSFIVSLFIHTEGSRNLYMGLNLSALHQISLWHYVVMTGLIIILSGLKAYMFFWVIKIISGINVSNPFNEYTSRLILKLSGIALQIGITALITNIYAKWLMKNTAAFSYDGGGTEFLYLAGILFVIAVIFKRGIEIQKENELTI